MYFLAILLTLRILEPGHPHLSVEDTHEFLRLPQVPPGTDAHLGERRVRVALLRRDQEFVYVRLTCFSRGERSPGDGVVQALTPVPDPQTLFTSALRHWRLLDGPLLPYTGTRMAQVAKCVVSEYRLETADYILAGHAHPGFLGWIEYVCRTRESSVIVSLNALARLAFFSGSGYLTERGLGVTAVMITN
jgi:hypothetical protein